MYEQKIFRIKTIAYSFEKVLGYQVVDKKIMYVKNAEPHTGGMRYYGSSFQNLAANDLISTRKAYKKKALVVKTQKTNHSWGKSIDDKKVSELHEVFHEAMKAKK